MEYINNHLPGFWIALGFAMLAAEVLLFGFTTIIFLFGGLGALVTGLLMMIGILPETWLAGIASFGISTGIISTILWVPLKKLQSRSEPKQQSHSDFIGLEFTLDQDISPAKAGQKRYSGIQWKVEIAPTAAVENLAKGQRVRVDSVDVGVFRVLPVE